MMDEDAKLTVEILNEKLIDLNDFTEGFSSIGQQYMKFLMRNPTLVPVEDVKLFIKDVRSGSIQGDCIKILDL